MYVLYGRANKNVYQSRMPVDHRMGYTTHCWRSGPTFITPPRQRRQARKYRLACPHAMGLMARICVIPAQTVTHGAGSYWRPWPHPPLRAQGELVASVFVDRGWIVEEKLQSDNVDRLVICRQRQDQQRTRIMTQDHRAASAH